MAARMEGTRRGRDLPERVGRYEVVARLETGGMAEILLGRITGPSGFERPVVIKRILPHLARNPRFVEMFLDEARIVAGIRHPNVVHVQELISEEDEVFLVLEYLEGETAASLLRRLKARGQRLPPAVAAHIAAEACAGLHEAHELVSPGGAPLDVVHRDVSPSNLFVTYHGAVKVLDFGIAKAADRIASTEAGEIKGKVSYMSPEQAAGVEIDRRSDIHALGIVLYELSTGKNPRARATSIATLQAALGEPVVPPSRLVPSYPPALEAVCLKALAPDREARHATALEMRRELLGAIAAAGGEASAQETLARLMRELFADRIEEKRAQLRQMGGGSTPPSPPARGRRDEGTSIPTSLQRPAARIGRRAWMAAPLLLAVAVAGWLAARSGRRPDTGACASSALAVSGLAADWTTPQGIHWTWEARGAARDFLGFELVVGTDPAAVDARARAPGASAGAARVFTEADNPDLGHFERPRTQGIELVRATITDGHRPDTIYHARLVAVDVRRCRALSEPVTARTAVAPIDELVLFHDDPPALPDALSGYRLAGEGPHHGGARHLEYRSRCQPGQAACWQNLRVLAGTPFSLDPGPLSHAFLELALWCQGAGSVYWSELITCFGDDCRPHCDPACAPDCTARCEEARMFDFSPFAIACGAPGYRLLQVPLRAFSARPPKARCARLGPCAPSTAQAAAGKIRHLSLGGMWPHDAVVRVDEIRIRW